MSHQPTRRDLLKITAAAIASLILPRSLFATNPGKSFWFIHADTGAAWPVADPVQWCLHFGTPLDASDQRCPAEVKMSILERAAEGLGKLSVSDGDRIIRLVVRRCRLNLIELQPEHVAVQHWGTQGLADLRPFFKAHGLARPDIGVVVRDRKKETVTTQSGDDYLYGERLLPFWPLSVYWLHLFWKKWQRRQIQERNDWTAAPGTFSGFGWKGIEPHCIPWAALKSAWRRTTPMPCLNCDQPTIMTNFGLPQCSMLNREARFTHACRKCRRLFEDNSIDRFDVEKWMVSNLDAEVLPDFIVWMGKPTMWGPPTVDTIP